MVDPLSLAGLAGVALTEGIKFLYTQAGEALKRWWARDEQPIAVEQPGVVEGRLEPLVIDVDAAPRLEGDIQQLWSALAPYAQGMRPVDPSNAELVEVTDGLRRALEVLFGQRITFVGEDREPSGTVVRGTAESETVYGTLAGVIAANIRGGALVEGRSTSKEVAPGAVQAGTKVETIEG
jgi:hypothetical protein